MDGPLYYVKLVNECRKRRDILRGRQVHAEILADSRCRNDRLLHNFLIEMYGKCGSLSEARQVFERMTSRNVFTWNIMLSAYAVNGDLLQAKFLFERMPERDSVSWNTLITAYSQEDYMNEAWWLFQRMPARDRVSWNTMISAYAENGHCKRALVLFKAMDSEGFQPDEYTFLSALDACASLGRIKEGRHIHESASIALVNLESSVVLGSSLVNMYGKCGSVKEAEEVFSGMKKKNVISWTSLLSAYAQNGYSLEAVVLLSDMDLEGLSPNKVTFVSVLEACGSLSDVRTARVIHRSIAEWEPGCKTDVVIGTSLVDMYGKCGSPREARELFDGMPEKNVITWTAMIAGYARNGLGREGVAVYRRMDLEGQRPNYVTFVSLLDACAAIPSLALGRSAHADIRETYTRDELKAYSINVVVETALVTMYAKCGSMEDARDVFEKMERRNSVSWNAMVAGYTQNGPASQALEVFRVMDNEGVPKNDITLSMILAACSRCGLVNQGRSYFTMMVEDYGVEPTSELYSNMVDVLSRGGKVADAEELVRYMPFEPVYSFELCLNRDV